MFRGGLFIRRKFSAILFYSCRGRMPVEAKERQLPVATSPNLDDMKLPELKELAKQMGLRGVSTMRKTELIATLQAARSGGQAPAGVTVRAPKSAPAASAICSSTFATAFSSISGPMVTPDLFRCSVGIEQCSSIGWI